MYQGTDLKTITIRFEPEDYKELKLYTISRDIKMSDYIRGLIKADISKAREEGTYND